MQSNKHSDSARSWENVAFGFLTKHSPALLLAAQSHDQRYMAIALTQNGKSSSVCLFGCFSILKKSLMPAVAKKKIMDNGRHH